MFLGIYKSAQIWDSFKWILLPQWKFLQLWLVLMVVAQRREGMKLYSSNIKLVLIQTITVHAQSLSHVWLFATPWTVTHQGPLSVGFSWQEYLSGLPCPPPRDLLDSGIGQLRDQTHDSYVSCIGTLILY